MKIRPVGGKVIPCRRTVDMGKLRVALRNAPKKHPEVKHGTVRW